MTGVDLMDDGGVGQVRGVFDAGFDARPSALPSPGCAPRNCRTWDPGVATPFLLEVAHPSSKAFPERDLFIRLMGLKNTLRHNPGPVSDYPLRPAVLRFAGNPP